MPGRRRNRGNPPGSRSFAFGTDEIQIRLPGPPPEPPGRHIPEIRLREVYGRIRFRAVFPLRFPGGKRLPSGWSPPRYRGTPFRGQRNPLARGTTNGERRNRGG